MSARSVRRAFVNVIAAALVASLPLLPGETASAAPVQRLGAQPERMVQDAGRPPAHPPTVDAAAAAASRTTPQAVWPRPATAEIPVRRTGERGAPGKVGDLPVDVAAAPAAPGGEAPERVRVSVLDRAASSRADRPEVVLRVAAAKPGPVDLAVDVSAFRHAFGADWGNRLRLVALPECALSTPDRPDCTATPMPSRIGDGGRLTGQVRTATGDGALYAVAAGESGSTGSFAASSLSPSAAWSVDGNSGDFTWSYPLRVPSAPGGLTPSASLAYSAQSVDGRHAATNNQPSWVGEGFDLSQGFIERRYKSCADDLGGNNGQTKTGDLCWATNNALLTMSGRAGDLIKESGATDTWRLRTDDGTRIQLLKDKNRGVGDEFGEYWKVTERNGTQYFFGVNKPPGWTAASRTQSVWTVPVYGNNTGEPCNASTFDASHCVLPWRWNLDYVVDVHGNTMSLWYDTETNKYARNLTPSKVSTYVRGGALRRIDYGTRAGATHTDPPAQVRFDTADRCLSNCATHGANWPDTPWDLDCAATTCTQFAPTFWTTKRLSTVTTRVFQAGAWSTGDTWTLKHTFPDPGDTTRAGLWLSAIGQAGVPSEVKFEGVQMPNRVDTSGDYRAPMNWWRIKWIRSEFGGLIGVTYSPQECVAGSKVPTNPENNTLRCYPSKWTPSGFTDPVTDYFHKYVATEVTETDLSAGGTTVRTQWEYPNPPAWHYADEDGLVANKYQTWSVWRGYDVVRTTAGSGTERTHAERRYYRGMHGDKLPSGTRTVYSEDSEGGRVLDHDAFAGMLREEITYDGPGGAQVTGSVNVAWQSPPTASRTTEGVTVHARFVGTASARARTALDGGRGWRRTTTTTTYDDADGLVRQVADSGDDTRPEDDRCARHTYVHNGFKWITRITSTQVTALPCDRTATSAHDIISHRKVYYDGLAHAAVPPTGDATKVEELAGWNGGPTFFTRSQAEYDAHGRVTKSVDAEGHVLTNTFTPTTGGPLSRSVATNAKGYSVTTDYHPVWAEPVKVTDANGRMTELAYDGLGRLTQVWKPNRPRASSPTPSVSYTYRLPSRLPDGNPDGVPAVTTSTLGPNGNQIVTQALYDGMVRARQTQAPAGDGGGDRVITDTFYDSAGRPHKANVGYAATGAPSATLFTPAGGDASIEAQTLTTYDGVGRATATVLRRQGVELWRTSQHHTGDRVDTTPPPGGNATSVVTDARGEQTERRVYRSGQPTGAYDATTYAYGRKGQLTSVTDKVGNAWTYTYDDRGRQIKTGDPDKGESTVTWNNLDQVLTATDSRGRTLAYTYDELGRKTSMSEVAGSSQTVLGRWYYDTAPGGRGLLAGQSRHIGADVYSADVTGYSALGEPTGTKVTIPAVEGKLAGTYTFGITFAVDGSPSATSLPAAGGLPKETLGFGYNNAGKPNALTNSINLVAGQYVESTLYTKFGEPSVYTFATSATDKLVQHAFSYEATTRRLIRSLAKKSSSATPLADVRYTWNPAGDVTAIADLVASDTQCFRYDDLARLSQAWTPASGQCAADPERSALGGPAPYWVGYRYDDIGNRLSSTRYGATEAQDEITAYGYAAAQPHALRSTRVTVGGVAGPDLAYGYDSAGNTESMPGPQGQQALKWDTEGHLATVDDTSGRTSHVYDTSGNRLISRDPNGATLYLPGTELRLDRATDQVTATRFYTHGGVTVAQRTASGVVWLLPDRQGTAQISVGATPEQPVTVRRQTPFGERRGAAADWPNQRGFLDGTTDRTGTVHLGAREYDPSTGRFLSVDPVIDVQSAQQMHGYSYANNSPITYSDPSGLYLSSGSPKCSNGCSADQRLHNKRHKRDKRYYTGYGIGKRDGSTEVVDRGLVGIARSNCVTATIGPCSRTHGTVEMYGPVHSCAQVTDAVGTCFLGSDGHVWDLYGHRSCAEPGSLNACVGEGAGPLPRPVAYGTYSPKQVQTTHCEIPGARQPPAYFSAPPNQDTIRSGPPSLLPDLPGSVVGGVELCVLTGCIGLAVHEEGIDFSYGQTLGLGSMLGIEPKIGYTSAPTSLQDSDLDTYSGCASGSKVGICGSYGKRKTGDSWWGVSLGPGGGGFSGGWSSDVALYRWSGCAGELQARCLY